MKQLDLVDIIRDIILLIFTVRRLKSHRNYTNFKLIKNKVKLIGNSNLSDI
ncbi:MAG: hypothetical protein HeimC2_04590 [Candidatus Heimdallarchaeota archaeon LC_2]|nr:MAG: hypothetical protein HeimC2_04590 [Candidatus Heimdallarchaeota archaeon LC_2]